MSPNEEYIRKNKVMTVDDDKNSKLHYAASLNNIEVLTEETATGQKLDPENYLGWTPLMMAVRNGNHLAVNFLLEHRADATKKNRFGVTVFLLSVGCGDLDIVTQILQHLMCGGISRQNMQKTISPISLAILFSHQHILKYLIEQSFDVNAATPLTEITPLMFAAAMGNNKAVKRLIQQHADPKRKNHLGKTSGDITASKNICLDIDYTVAPKSPNVPVIFVTPHAPATPGLQLTPFPMMMARSSNTNTPSMLCSPELTPITPHLIPHHQVFFPQDFTPGQFLSPVYNHSNEMLNANISSIGNQSAYFSPLNQVCYQNYVS